MFLHLSRKDQWNGLEPVSEITTHKGLIKPKGAFWTSPAIRKPDSTYTSDWVEWCKVNRFYASGIDYVGVLLSVDRGAELYEIRDELTYDVLAEQFPGNINSPYSFLYGDHCPVVWDEVAEEYDGIGVRGRALGLRILSAWDVESVAFFNTECLNVEEVVNIELLPYLNTAAE